MSLKPMQKAAILIEALPHIQRFDREIVVAKYGGSAMVGEELKEEVIQDIVLLKLVGSKPIVVHGGGRETSHWIGKMGMEARFKNGLRVTDEPTTEITEMVLNKVNRSLVQLVSELGISAVGINGKDGMMLRCYEKYTDGEGIGSVGDMKEANPKIIYDLLEKDFLPIVCPIGFDEDFLSYNIDAGDTACAIAMAVETEKPALLTDVEGIYKDYEDKSSLISEMTVEEAQNFVDNGMLGGDMPPRLQNCINAIKSGVFRVRILDGRVPHCLLLEIFIDKGIGTAIYNSEEDERYYHGWETVDGTGGAGPL